MLSRLNSDDNSAGITMIELLVAISMMVVITGAAVSMLVSSLHDQVGQTKRADQVGTARNAIEKLTVDLRQGDTVTTGTPTQLALSTYCHTGTGGASTACTVSYSCAIESGKTTYRCTRKVNNGTARTFASGLLTGNVFCFVPSTSGTECGTRNTAVSTTYVGAKIELPASTQGGRTVLEDGAALHNSPGVIGG
jgi:type II secretory pathway pseudopilin PulG